jgi:hypothetical protein
MEYLKRLKIVTKLLVKKLTIMRELDKKPDNEELKHKLNIINELLNKIKKSTSDGE